MLRSAFPRAHPKYLSLPLLGPIADGFDDWLSASGFTRGSRKLAINLLPIADKKLRRRGVHEIAKLNHAVLDDCYKALKKKYPFRAGTIHTLERYLVANGLIVDARHAAATQPPSLSGEYADHLREVRGFAPPRFPAIGGLRSISSSTLEKADIAPGTIQTQQYRIVYHRGRHTAKSSKSPARYRRVARVPSLPQHRRQSARRAGSPDRYTAALPLGATPACPPMGNGSHTSTIHRPDVADGFTRLRDVPVDCHLRIARQRGGQHQPGGHSLEAAYPANPSAQDFLAFGTAAYE